MNVKFVVILSKKSRERGLKSEMAKIYYCEPLYAFFV
jgi:hypothetical protein